MKKDNIKTKAVSPALDRIDWEARAKRARLGISEGNYMPIFTFHYPEYDGKENEVRQVLNGRFSKSNYKDIVTKAEKLANSKKSN